MKITVLYVGTSLPGPLSQAQREINAAGKVNVAIALHNCGSEHTDQSWAPIEQDVAQSALLFIIHVTDSGNAARIRAALDQYGSRLNAIAAINCLPELMRCCRLGKLDFARIAKPKKSDAGEKKEGKGSKLTRRLGQWMADSLKRGRKLDYTKLISRLPLFLKLLPNTGKLRDIKNYLNLYCYFLQPTPANIRSMVLYAIKHYVPGNEKLRVPAPESLPPLGVYHPDATAVFEKFEDYQRWYEKSRKRKLDPENTVGLLLMRPQIVSNSRKHYDSLIRSLEGEGLGVIPAISTFLDNREACRSFFVTESKNREKPNGGRARVSQILSLTGFSFVGGPAMHDSDAAVEFLGNLNVPLRSMVSLDMQIIENWEQTRLGLNPVQTAMQVAIPEIDGATEPLIFGGMPMGGTEPIAIEERCAKIARRLKRWNRLRTAPRSDLRIALVIFCFPPNKGNVGTAAELDVFPSLTEILQGLKKEGYDVPESPGVDELRASVLGDRDDPSQPAAVAYRMTVEEYRQLCPYVAEIEREWGRAPGRINSNGRELLIQGLKLGNALIAVQPTFGYEGDPMRLLMAESGAPHHGFMALYTYIEKIFRADVVIHVGTHGSLEFMPGKQVGLSGSCWPDRLAGELPNVYIYSVNNPSEGSIAKRRSYAELVSYLTPPIENAGLYKELASLKELLDAYRTSADEQERARLFEAIEEQSSAMNI